VGVESGDEHDAHVAPQELQHLEAVELRHLDVQEEEVGLQLGRRLHGLEAVAALAHDLGLGDAIEVFAQEDAGRFLVVHDEDAHCAHGPGRGGRRRARGAR
jgi:hypothetical protein